MNVVDWLDFVFEFIIVILLVLFDFISGDCEVGTHEQVKYIQDFVIVIKSSK